MKIELKTIQLKKISVVRVERGLIERLRKQENQTLASIVRNALEICYIYRNRNMKFKKFKRCATDTANIGGYHQSRLFCTGKCNCRGYKTHGNCKHLREAISKACLWHEQDGIVKADDGKCPLCGGPVKNVNVCIES